MSVMKLDGWKNILTGLGYGKKDKRLSSIAEYNKLSEGEAEDIYASDSMAEKIVNKLPLDMLREGFNLVSPDIEDKQLDEAMEYYERLIQTESGDKIGDAMIWGRLYGGSALVIGTDSNDDPSEPLDIDRLGAIEHFTLLNRWELIPQDINGDPTSMNFGMPENYLIQPRITDTTQNTVAQEFSNNSILIHQSRLIIFDGSRLPRRTFIQNHYWHDSILNKLQGDLRDFQASFDSASALILDFAQVIYKIKNLADILSSPDGLATIQRRMAIIDQSRSILRATIIDADGEDFERKTTNMQGLDKVLDKITRKFTSSTEYPHTVLLGESPTGLGSSGNSEKQDYFEMIRQKQSQDLKPRLMKIFRLIFAAGDGPTGGKIPERFDIEFEPLKHLDQREKIEARKTQAESDKIYIEAGVIDPDEVAMSRFGLGEYSFETEIEDDLREPGSRIGETDQPDPMNIDSMHPKKKRKKRASRSRKHMGKKFK